MLRLASLALVIPLALGGCAHVPGTGQICLTPPYQAPGGFSETYAAALKRSGGYFSSGEYLASPGTIVGPPILAWPDLGSLVNGSLVNAPDFSNLKEKVPKWRNDADRADRSTAKHCF